MEEKEPNVEYEEQEYELESATIENEENEVEAEASIEGKILLEKTLKNKWFYIIGAMTMIFIYVFIISFSFLVKTTDGINYLAGGKKKNRSYREIYKTVESVQKEVYEETSVRVNKYLIISALTIFMNNDYYIDKSTGAFNYVSPETSDGSTKSMTVIKNFATVLAKYQIMTTDSCSASSETYREIASNDDEGLETFTLTAAAKEKNYNCGSKIPSGSPSTIQGRLNDNESGSLFYWNMIDENFFNNYYPELFMNLSKNGDYKEVYYQAADNALKMIYAYAETLKEYDENNSSGSSSSSSSGEGQALHMDEWIAAGKPVLNRTNGTVQGPSGKETYYNMATIPQMIEWTAPMCGPKYGLSASDAHIRSDGVWMLGDYVICALPLSGDYSVYEHRCELFETSLGTCIALDSGGMTGHWLDIAVNW